MDVRRAAEPKRELYFDERMVAMNVVLISGSSNRTGPTAKTMTSVLEGIHAGGGSGRRIWLPALRIQQCRYCHHSHPGPCRPGGACTVRDDFDELMAALSRADGAVFSSPVYLGGLAGPVRAFLHRLARACQLGEVPHGVAGTPAVGVCVGGGATRQVRRLRAALGTCGFSVLDVIAASRRLGHAEAQELRAIGLRLAAAGESGAYEGGDGESAPQPRSDVLD